MLGVDCTSPHLPTLVLEALADELTLPGLPWAGMAVESWSLGRQISFRSGGVRLALRSPSIARMAS